MVSGGILAVAAATSAIVFVVVAIISPSRRDGSCPFPCRHNSWRALCGVITLVSTEQACAIELHHAKARQGFLLFSISINEGKGVKGVSKKQNHSFY